jgi:hypothetical protein
MMGSLLPPRRGQPRVTPAGAIADLSENNTVSGTFNATQVKTILDNQAVAVNDILAALRAAGLIEAN